MKDFTKESTPKSGEIVNLDSESRYPVPTFSDVFRARRRVPFGFRSNTGWKKALSVIYFFMSLLFLMSGIFSGNSDSFRNLVINKAETLIMFIALFSPYLFLSETGFRDKLPFFRKRSFSASVLGFAVFFAICGGLGFSAEAFRVKDKPVAIVTSEPEKEKPLWSESLIAANLPKPEFSIKKILHDTDDMFGFESEAVSEQDFKKYVKRCTAFGFIGNTISDGNEFRGENKSHITILISFDEVKKAISVIAEALPKSKSGITGIKFDCDTVKAAYGAKQECLFDVEGTEDWKNDDIEVAVSDSSVAKIETDRNKILLTGLKPGTAELQIKTTDGVIVSDKITVEVTQNISEIKIVKPDENVINLKPGESFSGLFSAETQPYTEISEMVFSAVSDDTETAVVSVNGTVGYTVTANKAGETYIYIMTNEGNVESAKVKVIVKEPQPAAAPAASSAKSNGSGGESSGSSGYSAEASSPQTTGETVYITPTGKKYHRSASCAGKNAIPKTLSEVSGSYGPCKKCA